ncbi:hypothetical protein K1719_001216 [Acacia pycnantha]|nr:hypothetical protein K1719_001216 [Acacia pycnantha]
MSSLRISTLPSSSSSSSLRTVNAAISVPRLPRVPISLPKIPTSSTTKLVLESNNNNGSLHTVIAPPEKMSPRPPFNCMQS